MNIYVFSQALDNKSEDDWYVYINEQLNLVENQPIKNKVHNLLSSITSKGKVIEDAKNCVKVFATKSEQKNCINTVLLIPNQTLDNLGRTTQTALIIEDLHKDYSLPFTNILRQFFEMTNRTKDLQQVNQLADNCLTSITDLKKKLNGSSFSMTVLVLSVIILIIFLMLIK